MQELADAGHQPVSFPGSDVLDITDAIAVERAVRAEAFDAIAHLAAVASRSAARRDPARTYEVNVRGTSNVVDAAAKASPPVPILLTSTSEVYARADPDRGAITEAFPLVDGGDPYSGSKRAAEAVIVAAAERGHAVAITRAFNHTGPGQRAEFAIPAFARRIIDARQRGDDEIIAGNVDVERDIGDVRDTVRAYRLVLEHLIESALPTRPVFNVATGRPTRLRDIIESMGHLAGVRIRIRRDESLVRADDPPRIVGDATALRAATGWAPIWPLEATLRDVLDDARRSAS